MDHKTFAEEAYSAYIENEFPGLKDNMPSFNDLPERTKESFQKMVNRITYLVLNTNNSAFKE